MVFPANHPFSWKNPSISLNWNPGSIHLSHTWAHPGGRRNNGTLNNVHRIQCRVHNTICHIVHVHSTLVKTCWRDKDKENSHSSLHRVTNSHREGNTGPVRNDQQDNVEPFFFMRLWFYWFRFIILHCSSCTFCDKF